MGLRESRISFFPYEAVQKRVNEEELKRLRTAFKRIAGASGVMSKPLFLREVLGENFPQKLAEQIYYAFGGTSKGIYLKDLVCGIVLLTRGSLLDRLKFVFEIYSGDGNQILRDDMESLLLASEGGRVPEAIVRLFSSTDRIGCQEFCEWLRRNPDSITLSKWLVKQGNGLQLTDYGETPTFYQTLAKFTGLQELDIIELEKRYWYLKSGTRTGKFDVETFTPLIASCVPEAFSKALFDAFDENHDGHIDFREIACGISTCCRGPIAERFAFTFKIFDVDRDGLLSEQELLAMVMFMTGLKSENIPHSPVGETAPEIDSAQLVSEILNDYDSDKDGFITLDEYKTWATTQYLSRLVLDILFQICHVIFGLRPATRKDEYQVIWGWLDRENFRGLQPGTTWYLVAMDWWKRWKEFVGRQKFTVARSLSTSALERNGVSPLTSSLSSTTSQAWDKMESSQKKTLASRRASQPLRSVAPVAGINGHMIPNGIMSKPGTIDNSVLVEQEARKIQTLTGDGGKLKCTVPLVRGRDFEIVPEPVWKALVQWYTGSPALPRNVIIPTDGDPTPVLELFPRMLLLYRHAQPPAKNNLQSWTGFGFGLNGLHFGSSAVTTAASVITPRRQLSYTAVFSRMHTLQQLFEFVCQRLRLKGEDVRLWNMADENNLQLLDEDQFGQTLEAAGIEDRQPILIEIRNRDMSWPEEMTSLALNKTFQDKRPHGKGMIGLSNLGNTCFMNSAIQCMSNTIPLTSYFTDGYHLYELNKTNPLGMKGNIAKRYGEVVQDLWSASCRSIAPLKLRWTIGRYAPRFNGFQQQDSQEFLAFLLDGLHEDLNRVHSKPYVELKDSDGRPDEEVAQEAWDNHLKRNQSIIVDLFQGQLKSCVRCLHCNHVSVRFDPYTFLSLPIPMDNSIYVECIVVTLDGQVPIKYGLLLSTDDKYKKLKKQLAKLCGLTPAQLLMAEVIGATIKGIPFDGQKVRSSLSGILYAFEIPPPPSPPPSTADDSASSCVSIVTTTETALDGQTGGTTTADPRGDERETSAAELPARVGDPLRETLTVRAELVRSPSRTSSERSLGGSLKLPCLSRQTSDDDDVDECIEMASEASAKGNVGLLRQLSPRFLRKLSSRKSGSGVITSEGAVTTSELRDHQSASSAVTTPGHSRNTSISSTCGTPVNGTPVNGTPVHPGLAEISQKPRGYVLGLHRKLMRMDVYFIAPQKNRPSLFGCPMIIPCTPGTKNSQLYSSVWQQVSRFVSAPPPGEDLTPESDNDYPFELKVVSEGGLSCAVCPWYKFCRGCTIECNDEEFNCNCQCIAIEWEPTTLHLRYQSSQEKVFSEHGSVEESRRLQTEPIDLYECFKAFTKEEELGEDELWYCSKCRKHQLASKKLDIWSLPPILIIHLKRFQFMNGRWVKSNKVVNFAMEHFDPSEFVVKRSTARNTEAAEDDSSVRTVTVRTVDKDGENRECCPEMSTDAADKELIAAGAAAVHGGSSDSELSSNSSTSASEESHASKQDCELNGDSGYCSQSSSQTGPQTGSDTGLQTGSHSGSQTGSQSGPHQRKHSGKIHPVTSNKTLNSLAETMDTGKKQTSKDAGSLAGSNSSLERCENDGAVCQDCSHDETDVASNCSSGSKTSDTSCVGISSVDLCDVESRNSSRNNVSQGQRLESGEQEAAPSTMLYNLYTISSHAGVMGGGHYVSFSKNPNSKWYCFNDSSCKETTSERVQKESPYLLFYERVGVEYKNFLPDVKDCCPDSSSNDEDDIDGDFKRNCVVQ